MTIMATATRDVACSPETFLEFVMDVRRYQEVDEKIRPVLWSRRRGNVSEFIFMGRLVGMWAPPSHSRMVLTPGRRIDIVLAPTALNAPARLLTRFRASFVCTPTQGGIRVERTLVFDLRGPLRRWERVLESRLQAQVDEEMDLAVTSIEQKGRRA